MQAQHPEDLVNGLVDRFAPIVELAYAVKAHGEEWGNGETSPPVSESVPRSLIAFGEDLDEVKSLAERWADKNPTNR